MEKGINIFSGEGGLGSALTNPTRLARQKGVLSQDYPVRFCGETYPDVESAYQRLRGPLDPEKDDALMVDLIASKFDQHRDLFYEVQQRGGVEFLAACTHYTYAQTPAAQAWEGAGGESRFIRNLIRGYERAQAGQGDPQQALF